MFVGHLYVFFGEKSVEVIHPIFEWVCFSDIELHELFILEINPLSVALFANIISHSEGCLFILFLVFLAMQKR